MSRLNSAKPSFAAWPTQCHGSLTPSGTEKNSQNLYLTYFLNMAPSFLCFLPFRQTPTPKINTTLQPTPPTPPFSRTMESGPCTAVVAVGTFKVPCPCLRRKYTAPLPTLDAGCERCGHPLFQHENASFTPVPDSFLLPQGMGFLPSFTSFQYRVLSFYLKVWLPSFTSFQSRLQEQLMTCSGPSRR